MGTAGNVLPGGKTSLGGGFRKIGENQGKSMDITSPQIFSRLLGCCLWVIWDFGVPRLEEERDVLAWWEPGAVGYPGMMEIRKIGMSWHDGSGRSKMSWDDGNQEERDVLA